MSKPPLFDCFATSGGDVLASFLFIILADFPLLINSLSLSHLFLDVYYFTLCLIHAHAHYADEMHISISLTVDRELLPYSSLKTSLNSKEFIMAPNYL